MRTPTLSSGQCSKLFHWWVSTIVPLWLKEGAYPDSLNSLVPAYLTEIPVDRVTGGALHYRVKEDGTVQIYSVGIDREDDGGVPRKNPEEGDWVWQYTHPDFDEEAYKGWR